MIYFNKTNIIILALLYNYLANKESIIKKNYFEMFFNELNYELLLNGKKLICEEESEQNVYTNKKDYIKFSNINEIPYSLINLKRTYVDVLPNEVIKASLSKDVLSCLKINRKDINTKTCLEPKYLLNNKEAYSQEKIKKLNRNKNDYYSIEREVIDIDSLIEEYESKQK